MVAKWRKGAQQAELPRLIVTKPKDEAKIKKQPRKGAKDAVSLASATSSSKGLSDGLSWAWRNAAKAIGNTTLQSGGIAPFQSVPSTYQGQALVFGRPLAVEDAVLIAGRRPSLDVSHMLRTLESNSMSGTAPSSSLDHESGVTSVTSIQELPPILEHRAGRRGSMLSTISASQGMPSYHGTRRPSVASTFQDIDWKRGEGDLDKWLERRASITLEALAHAEVHPAPAVVKTPPLLGNANGSHVSLQSGPKTEVISKDFAYEKTETGDTIGPLHDNSSILLQSADEHAPSGIMAHKNSNPSVTSINSIAKAGDSLQNGRKRDFAMQKAPSRTSLPPVWTDGEAAASTDRLSLGSGPHREGSTSRVSLLLPPVRPSIPSRGSSRLERKAGRAKLAQAPLLEGPSTENPSPTITVEDLTNDKKEQTDVQGQGSMPAQHRRPLGDIPLSNLGSLASLDQMPQSPSAGSKIAYTTETKALPEAPRISLQSARPLPPQPPPKLQRIHASGKETAKPLHRPERRPRPQTRSSIVTRGIFTVYSPSSDEASSSSDSDSPQILRTVKRARNNSHIYPSGGATFAKSKLELAKQLLADDGNASSEDGSQAGSLQRWEDAEMELEHRDLWTSTNPDPPIDYFSSAHAGHGPVGHFLQPDHTWDGIVRPASAQSARSLDELIASLDLQGFTSRRPSNVSTDVRSLQKELRPQKTSTTKDFTNAGSSDHHYLFADSLDDYEHSAALNSGQTESVPASELQASRVPLGRMPVSIFTHTPHKSEQGHVGDFTETLDSSSSRPPLPVSRTISSAYQSTTKRDSAMTLRPQSVLRDKRPLVRRQLEPRQNKDSASTVQAAIAQFPTPPKTVDAFWPTVQSKGANEIVEEHEPSATALGSPRILGFNALGYGWDGPTM